MPRYFFNFENETKIVPDLVGREFPDDQMAKREAERLAGEIGITATMQGARLPFDWLEIVDDHERPVARLIAWKRAARRTRRGYGAWVTFLWRLDEAAQFTFNSPTKWHRSS